MKNLRVPKDLPCRICLSDGFNALRLRLLRISAYGLLRPKSPIPPRV